MQTTVIRLTAVATTILIARAAHAFGEDVCYSKDNSAMVNCLPIPDACLPVGTDTDACHAAALAVAVQSKVNNSAGRSLVHTDAVHVIAQAVGFSNDDAYWIAAYDEAIDLGEFILRDAEGAPLDETRNTVSLDGLTRSNFETGGVLLHFVAPRAHGTDGLNPEIDDATVEVTLAHLRAWAFDATDLACAGGLTVPAAPRDYANGDACFARQDEPTSIEGSLAAVADSAIHFEVSTGLQVIADDITSEAFDVWVGEEHAANARIGVYLHVLSDRISHHVCTDGSLLDGPSLEGNFTVDMTGDDCMQGVHMLRHMWETGVAFDSIDAEHRTTISALTLTYDELLAFADNRGVARSEATNAAYREALLEGLIAALQLPEPTARIEAISQVACDSALTPFPGTPACP